MNSKKFVIALVHVDMEHGTVGDIFQGVGPHGRIVESCAEAKRYSSLRRALAAAQGWTWYADIVRILEVD